MKEHLRKFIVSKKSGWWLAEKALRNLSRTYTWLKTARDERNIALLFPDLTVQAGPFKGMRYPRFEAVGSSISPKILGTYENELSSIISTIIDRPYSAIVDVGCAEGYYAVGLGMHHKAAKIFAYDTDEKATHLCREMADLNRVDLIVGGFCDKQTLLEAELGNRALVFIDCEGYEIELIDRDLAQSLKSHDFLIEAHDFVHRGTTEKLLAMFQATHSCEVVQSITDHEKAIRYQFSGMRHLSYLERRDIVGEHRPETMNWIFAQAKM